MSNSKIKKIVLATSLILVLSWLWIKRIRTEVPAEKFAHKFLVQKIGSIQADQLLEQYRKNYKDLLHHTTLPKDRVLQIHLKYAVLPVLAFYQVLLPLNNGNQERTIDEITQVVREWVLRLTKGPLIALKYFPQPFTLFKPGFNLVMMLFPSAGFDIDYLEKSNNRIAYNINRCFFLDTLSHYGLPELTPVFCAADEAMAEFFPPSIKFKRTQTLGKGGNLCDFRYCNQAGKTKSPR